MCRDMSNGDADVLLLGDPLIDIKLLGRATVSRTAREFRHCARYETAGLLCAFMSQVLYFVYCRYKAESPLNT